MRRGYSDWPFIFEFGPWNNWLLYYSSANYCKSSFLFLPFSSRLQEAGGVGLFGSTIGSGPLNAVFSLLNIRSNVVDEKVLLLRRNRWTGMNTLYLLFTFGIESVWVLFSFLLIEWDGEVYCSCWCFLLEKVFLSFVRHNTVRFNSNNTSLFLSHYRVKTSSHTEKALALITTRAQRPISPRFLTIFSFTDVSDVQDKLRKYICIIKVILVISGLEPRTLSIRGVALTSGQSRRYVETNI